MARPTNPPIGIGHRIVNPADHLRIASPISGVPARPSQPRVRGGGVLHPVIPGGPMIRANNRVPTIATKVPKPYTGPSPQQGIGKAPRIY